MQKIIGIRVHGLTGAQKEQIKRTAPGFTLLDITGEYTDGQIEQCEIIFGNIAPERMKYAKNLKWNHTQFAGVEAYCKPEIILPEYFTNAAGAYGIAISEHLIMMTMVLQRHIPGYVKNMQERKWRHMGKVRSIYGSSVAVAGLGDIGGCFARKMHALGAGVKAIVRKERGEYPSYISDACLSADTEHTDKILSAADIIALCLPHTPETINFLSAARIKKLKPGVIILNVGRGSAIDEDALADGLESGHIGGAGLDVTVIEPLPESSRLWACPNIIITPHVSGGASLDFTGELIFDKFIKYLGDYVNGIPFAADMLVDRDAGY